MFIAHPLVLGFQSVRESDGSCSHWYLSAFCWCLRFVLTAHDFQVIEQSGVIFTLSVMIQSRPEAFQVDVLIDSIADVLETDTFREPAYY